jgi:hypothetical protein
MSSSEDDIPLAARAKSKPRPPNDNGMLLSLPKVLLMRLSVNIPVKDQTSTAKVPPKRVTDIVGGQVDATGSPSKPHPRSVGNKAVKSGAPPKKKKRIAVSDDESDDDNIPLVLELTNV